jgi:hypothetical protein
MFFYRSYIGHVHTSARQSYPYLFRVFALHGIEPESLTGQPSVNHIPMCPGPPCPIEEESSLLPPIVDERSFNTYQHYPPEPPIETHTPIFQFSTLAPLAWLATGAISVLLLQKISEIFSGAGGVQGYLMRNAMQIAVDHLHRDRNTDKVAKSALSDVSPFHSTLKHEKGNGKGSFENSKNMNQRFEDTVAWSNEVESFTKVVGSVDKQTTVSNMSGNLNHDCATSSSRRRPSHFSDVDTNDFSVTQNKVKEAVFRNGQEASNIRLSPIVMFEQMVDKSSMLETMYPYLAKPMRTKKYFTWMLSNPVARSQLEDSFEELETANLTRVSMVKLGNDNRELIKKLEALGINPRKIISSVMAEPHLVSALDDVNVQKILLDTSTDSKSISENLRNLNTKPSVKKFQKKIQAVLMPAILSSW